MSPKNDVEIAMEILGIKTVREFAKICKVSEKTMTGWKKKITPLGGAIIELILDNHLLKQELNKSRNFKAALRDMLND
jgi:hypothetical protein